MLNKVKSNQINHQMRFKMVHSNTRTQNQVLLITGVLLMGKSRNRRAFSKMENLRFLQNYDDYNCMLGIKLKGLSLSFIPRSCSEKNMIFAKNAFLKLENIHNCDIYFHPLRNFVLKLVDDKCKAKACEILTQSY